MPGLRRQLPAHSPISPAGIAAAVAGSVREPAGAREELARQLCAAFDARQALLVGSGTDALRLALAGVRAMGSNRPLALPAYSCYDVATAAEGADVDALLYDLDPDTLSPEDGSLRRTLEGGPAAIVAAHLYGYPVDMERMARLARDAGAVLIEDAAQAGGGRLRGAPLGSFGSLTVLSFGRGKGMTAGSGGALLAHDETGARILAWAMTRVALPAAGLRDAIMLGVQWALGRPAWYGLPSALPFLHLGETVYHAPSPPSAMSRAAIGALAVTLRTRDSELAGRRARAAHLLTWASGSGRVRVVEPVNGAEPGFLRLPLRVVERTVAEALRALANHGAALAYPRALPTLPSFAPRVRNADAGFDGARILAETLLTFPTHRFVAPSDLAALEGWLLGDRGNLPRGDDASHRTPAGVQSWSSATRDRVAGGCQRQSDE